MQNMELVAFESLVPARDCVYGSTSNPSTWISMYIPGIQVLVLLELLYFMWQYILIELQVWM